MRHDLVRQMRVLSVSIAAMAMVSFTASGSLHAAEATPELPVSGAGAPAEDNCLRVASINDFDAIDDRTAVFREGVSRRFKVTFFGICPALDFATAIKVESRGMMCLSTGDSISFIGPDIIHPDCVIDAIEYLPPEPAPAN